MGRRSIELVKVLLDQIHQGGYQHRVLEDSIYAETQKRIAAEKDRDHWKQARQEAHEAGELMKAELEKLRGAMAADDKRLRDAEARVWPERTLGCDAPDAMADEILHLRQQLDAARAAVTLQRAGIERLQEVVTKCRRLVGHYISYADINSLRSALAELDAGTEPTPVAEPIDAEGGA